MPDDDDILDDPFRTENRSHPDGKAGPDIFRESEGRKSQQPERRERRPERPPDKDDD